MSGEARGPRDPRFATWIGSTIVLFVAAVAVGFFWLPTSPASGVLDLWASICRAAGQPVRDTQALQVGHGPAVSNVAWTTATRRLLQRGDAARGAALATTCNNCHGSNGVSADAIFPNLAGQDAASLFKQLQDFKSGKRDPAVMGVYLAAFSEPDIVDLATHFASLPVPPIEARAAADASAAAARRLAQAGDPSRGIAGCAACHGPLGVVIAAPPLRDQQRAYLEVQLLALAANGRHNDIGAQMRSIARRLTGNEIAALAAYYAAGGD
jgi:cytochrome c553